MLLQSWHYCSVLSRYVQCYDWAEVVFPSYPHSSSPLVGNTKFLEEEIWNRLEQEDSNLSYNSRQKEEVDGVQLLNCSSHRRYSVTHWLYWLKPEPREGMFKESRVCLRTVSKAHRVDKTGFDNLQYPFILKESKILQSS